MTIFNVSPLLATWGTPASVRKRIRVLVSAVSPPPSASPLVPADAPTFPIPKRILNYAALDPSRLLFSFSVSSPPCSPAHSAPFPLTTRTNTLTTSQRVLRGGRGLFFCGELFPRSTLCRVPWPSPFFFENFRRRVPIRRFPLAFLFCLVSYLPGNSPLRFPVSDIFP